MEDKIKALLGFARKAGKLAVGTSAVYESIKKQKAKLVLSASDISEKSKKELSFNCQKQNISHLILTLSTEEVSRAIGRRAGILALEDEGFAKAIKELPQNLGGNANGYQIQNK